MKMSVLIEKPKVLVVDDDGGVVKTLLIVFSKAGYEARGVESAEVALALIEAEQWVPQFAIVDVHLPAMNGIDLAIMFKGLYPNMRVSLFSGRPSTSDLLEVANRQGHSFEVLPKPVHPSVFLELLASTPSEDVD